MRKCVVASVIIALVLALANLIACGGGDNDKKEGVLPVLNIGDKWTQRGIIEGIEYTTTTEMVGEDVCDGKACYVIEITFEPSFAGLFTSMAGKFNKATMDLMRVQFTGKTKGETFIAASTYSYSYSAFPFPYEVGKVWEVTETENSTFTIMGETETDKEENTHTYKVVGMETITVPAGTFECFKVVKYQDDDFPIDTYWKSDTVNLFDVKTYDHETDETMELISYSISD